MKKYRIPASVTLAQGIIESNNGNSRLAKKAKNHFGIKCHGWEGKKIYADDDKKNECFRSYKNVAHSFEDHSLFLTKYKRYKFLFEYKITDYKAWSKGLKKAGYATSSKYADLLIKIIEENELYKYDKLKKIKSVRRLLSQTNRKIYLHPNNIKYTIVKQKETLLTISKELDIRLWQLYKYNEIDKNYDLKEGEKIFIQPKRNKSKTASHKVKEGETIRLISEKYGVKIKKLTKRNRDLITLPVQTGDIIKLK
jgi:LysM repeat protein